MKGNSVSGPCNRAQDNNRRRNISVLSGEKVAYQNQIQQMLHKFHGCRCKKSGRKHKKWEGDAVLVVKKDLRLAILNGLVRLLSTDF